MHPIRHGALAIVLAISLSVSGHVFNHQDRHEVCDVFTAPYDHGPGDGHAHDHAGPAADARHDHDPCKQVGMQTPMFADMPPLTEVPLADGVFEALPGTTIVSEDDEAFVLDVERLREQANLVVAGDAGLRGMGFPGSGTPEDPYIIEGFLIRNALLIRDTSACVVVRNNVIDSFGVEGPLADLEDVIDLAALVETLRAAYEEAMRQRAFVDSHVEALDGQASWWQDEAARWHDELETWHERLEAKETERQEAAAHEAEYEAALAESMAEAESLQDSFVDWSRQYQSAPAPAKVDRQAADDEVEASFEAYMDDVQDYIEQQAPPNQPPKDWKDPKAQEPPAEEPEETTQADETSKGKGKANGNAAKGGAKATTGSSDDDKATKERWKEVKETHRAYVKAAKDAVQEYEDAVRPKQPAKDEAAVAAERDDLEAGFEAFFGLLADFDAEHRAFLAALDESLARQDAVHEATAEAISVYEVASAEASQALFKYAGIDSAFLFDTIRELIDHLLELARELLDEAQTAKLILDWNGQCIHAYHNVIEDLRVNRNVARTGYATGGIIEDNRIHDIGQIRHYDGVLRDNEIGDRDHLRGLLGLVEQPPTEQSVNNDGYNQGWIVGNTIYGRIDLDYHGHHHGSGFFAPESHYHGSDQGVAYMGASATHGCAYYQDDYGYERQREPQEYIGLPPLDEDGRRCLPHHNHGFRWTSVAFEDNVVIDPLGSGIRYEDRNHRADDEQAASEDMLELKAPHFHRTHIALADNVVIGSVFVDRFNADGTDLWSDDWSEVQQDDLGHIIEAIEHLGAEVVNSHPMRNDAWLDITGNTVFVYGSGHGIRLLDAKEIELSQVQGNAIFSYPTDTAPATDAAGLLAWLRASADRDPDATAAKIEAWGGTDPGGQTGILVQDVQDALLTVCHNVMRGMELGMMATQKVYEDVSVLTCADNDWGGAEAVRLAFTKYPPDEEHLSDDLRPITDATPAKGVADAVYDSLDRRGV